MNFFENRIFYSSLPGMDVYLTSCFFRGLTDRPRRLHIHPCYELVCVEESEEMTFTIIPPLYEHLSIDASPEKVSSVLFSFSPEDSKDICMEIKKILKPTVIKDTFDGVARIHSIKKECLNFNFGSKDQISAELRLLFIGIARSICVDKKAESVPCQTLDNERIARLEEYFNIQLKDANCSKQQLAEYLGICERQLSRILEEIYHSNFSSILLQSRMTLAQAMIEQGEKTIEQIAEEVGYISTTSFKKAYHKFFGASTKI